MPCSLNTARPNLSILTPLVAFMKEWQKTDDVSERPNWIEGRGYVEAKTLDELTGNIENYVASIPRLRAASIGESTSFDGLLWSCLVHYRRYYKEE